MFKLFEPFNQDDLLYVIRQHKPKLFKSSLFSNGLNYIFQMSFKVTIY